MIAVNLLLASLSALAVTAQGGGKKKSGYDDIPQFGGPRSAGANLKEDNEIRKSFFRIEGIDEALKLWFGWKGDPNKKYGFSFGLVGTAGIIAH